VSRYLADGKQKYLLPKSEFQILFVASQGRIQVTLQNAICGPQRVGLQIHSFIYNYNARTNTLKILKKNARS